MVLWKLKNAEWAQVESVSDTYDIVGKLAPTYHWKRNGVTRGRQGNSFCFL